eukprot:jgi/Mesen1/6817/ME000035S06205
MGTRQGVVASGNALSCCISPFETKSTKTVDSLISLAYPQAGSKKRGRVKTDNPCGILAFEVAAAMKKALDLWHSLHKAKLDGVLQSEGVMKLVSQDRSLLSQLAGTEHVHEVKSITKVVAVLGRRTSSSMLQDVEADILKLTGRTQLVVSPPLVDHLLDYLTDLVDATSNLHAQSQAMDISQDSSRSQGLQLPWATPALPPTPTEAIAPFAKAKMDEKAKMVKKLRAMSLWGYDFARAIQLLVLILALIHGRIKEMFGEPLPPVPALPPSLGSAGLSFHYARLVLQIARMVERPTMVFRSAREELYGKLPTRVARTLRSRLKGQARPFDIDVAAEMKCSMEALLSWLVPMAHATFWWQQNHSYGTNFVSRPRVLLLETLHYARIDDVEVTVVELLVGLSYIARPIGLSKPQEEEQAMWKQWVASAGQFKPRSGLISPPPSSGPPQVGAHVHAGLNGYAPPEVGMPTSLDDAMLPEADHLLPPGIELSGAGSLAADSYPLLPPLGEPSTVTPSSVNDTTPALV